METDPQSKEFQQFEKLAKRLVGVPKKEIDRRLEEERRQKEERKARKA